MKQYSISELPPREKIALKDILNIDWSKNIMITNPLSGNPIKDFGSSLELAQDLCELPTPKGMSFGENSPLFFPASFCHCFLGHEVVHPQEGSPQA